LPSMNTGAAEARAGSGQQNADIGVFDFAQVR
jgi:hypothetical protein